MALNDDQLLWQTKLHARFHDPAEKALILMRTAHGHEGGTSRQLQDELFPQGIPDAVKAAVKRADRWASAADRAAFPSRDGDGRYAQWQQVEFHKRPVIIHPLTGECFDIQPLTDIAPAHAEQVSLDHFKKLLDQPDLPRKALAAWRFGPEIDAPDVRNLWPLLPADTRVPDHSIWDHLDLTVAFAGTFARYTSGGPALLSVNLGPVQQFIASSRTTSDLWAGSHLLSRIAWEAMKVVCEALGPEAIVFPRLRGVPQVDLWLIKDCGLSPTLFADCEWKTAGSTDANPLFVAALPNRFTALVPANQAKALAESIVRHVRRWVMDQGRTAFRKLLNAAGMEDDAALYGYRQLEAQLAEFPEVHWASIPWSLISTGEGDTVASTETLCRAMKSFFVQNPPGFLGSQAWSLLSKQIELEQGWFWRPNPGTLYPALHELLDRVLAATKSLRPFGQSEQPGWRCSLTGEAEWLTTERSHLDTSPRTQTGTLWAKVTEQRPAWARKGEHLGALATLKRLWPSLFVDEIQDFLDDKVQRFVVSTHTMALTGAIGKWLNANNPLPADMAASIRQAERPALPRGLVRKLREHSDADLADLLARLPSWIEAADTEDDDRSGRLRKVLGQEQVESYYALTMMDGDRMGAWISGDSDFTLAHKSCFHPQIVAGLERFRGDPKFKQYAEAPRAANPARHMAISDALNNFALRLAPDIVELHHDGRLLYAGGDDLLAMLPVNKLLSAMAALRAAYSGIEGSQVGAPAGALSFSRQKNGFVKQKNGRLLRLMGDKATASIGAVVAHHKAPLNAVLGELRAAEQRAKQEGGRDAFSITVVKRSGGALKLTCRWRLLDESPSGGESPMAWLRELSEALADGEASRRAAYHVQTWSVDLPEPQQLGETEWRRMFSRLVAQQFERQGIKDAAKHAQRLATLAPSDSALKASTFINNFLSVAEFLCREARI